VSREDSRDGGAACAQYRRGEAGGQWDQEPLSATTREVSPLSTARDHLRLRHLSRQVLHGPGQHAELVALRVGEHHPRNVRPLTDVDAAGAEVDEPLDLLPLGAAIGAEVEVQAVLRDLRSGTRATSMPGAAPPSGARLTMSASSSTMRHPSTAAQKSAMGRGSMASMTMTAS
jgi:hypothetical protein